MPSELAQGGAKRETGPHRRELGLGSAEGTERGRRESLRALGAEQRRGAEEESAAGRRGHSCYSGIH